MKYAFQSALRLTLLLIICLASVAYGQVSISTLPYLTVSTRTGARLGLKYMHEQDGSTTATGTANVARLNEWSGRNEAQTVFMGGTVTGGSFTLTYSGQTTAGINWNADANAVNTALVNLSNIDTSDVTSSGGPLPSTPVTVTFTGALGTANLSTMTANGVSLTGTSPTVSVAESMSGLSADWIVDRLRLDLQGRVALGGSVPWSLPVIDGVRIVTNGYGIARAEPDFSTRTFTGSIQGGTTTGFAWVDKTQLTGPMIRLLGFGGEMGHFRVDGNIGTGLFSALVADAANRKAIGVELQDTALNAYGVGKYHFDSFTPNFCVVGMAVTGVNDIENGDESRIDIFRPTYCDIGFLSQHVQALGFTFGYCAQGEGMPTMWKYEKGSDLNCEYLLASTTDSLRGVLITGSDSTVGNGSFTLNQVLVDEGCNDAYKLVEVRPTQVQSVIMTGTVTGGTFTLSYGGQTTAALAYNATASAIDAALEGLSTVGAGNVVCSGGPLPGTPVSVAFTGKFTTTAVTDLTATSSLSGTSPGVVGYVPYNAASIRIHYLKAALSQIAGAPMFDLRNHYGQLAIDGGVNFRSQMIKVTGGDSAFFSTVRIKNGKFKIGTDVSTVREYFTSDSRGYVQVIVEDNSEAYGGTGNVNGGKTYPEFNGLINITNNGQDDFTIISGGYSTAYSGVYPPTVANVANANLPSAATCQYMRVGDTVTVSGRITLTPAAGGSTLTRLSISLPVSSNFGSSADCAGAAGSAAANESAIILGDATTDLAWLQFYATSTAARDMYFTFTYRVLP